ncbi:MAG TPA: M56 family metallopeptidase [Terriglobia bacterium]|nr:M56 family metallopeptidase [Terriglobia bacterium]
MVTMSPLWFNNLLAASAQIALLVVVAALLPGAFRLRQPRVLLGYWTALLAACLLLPLLEPWRTVPQPPAGAAVTFRTGTIRVLTAAAPPAKHWTFPIYQVVALALLAGIVVRLIGLGIGLLRLRQYRRTALPLTPLPDAIKETQARTRTRAGFCLSKAVDSPVTFGLVRPVILMPERFLDFEAAQQATIACHELVHVRRHHWAQHLAEEFLRAGFWFHPAIIWLIARIRVAREQVVDLEVLELTGARRCYLEALLEIAAGRNLARATQAIPAPPFLVENQLAERVALMLKEVPMSRTRLIASLTAMLGCVAMIGALAVSSFPLKALPRESVMSDGVSAQGSRPQSHEAGTTTKPCFSSDPDCPKGGVIGGVVGGVPGGVVGGIVGGVITGVPGGVSGGIPGGVSGGVPGEVPVESVGGDDAPAPKLEHAVPPEYPPLAKMARIQGDVVLEVTIDEDGTVTNLEVEDGHPLLVKAAMDAVRQWKYSKPAVAPMHFEVTVHFELPKEAKGESTRPGADKEAYETYLRVLRDEKASAQWPAAKEAYENYLLALLRAEQAPPLKLVKSVGPVYPPEAKEKHIQGNVVLSVTVDKTGKVSNLEVLSGPEQLVKSALDAVKQWEYEPPAQAPVLTTVTVNFTLSDSGAQREGIYRVGGDVIAPKAIFKPEPPYTKAARKDKITGSVELSLVIDAEGNVTEARVVKALDPGLDQSALRTVRTWKFQPATRNGKPVPVRVTVETEFKLF